MKPSPSFLQREARMVESIVSDALSLVRRGWCRSGAEDARGLFVDPWAPIAVRWSVPAALERGAVPRKERYCARWRERYGAACSYATFAVRRQPGFRQFFRLEDWSWAEGRCQGDAVRLLASALAVSRALGRSEGSR